MGSRNSEPRKQAEKVVDLYLGVLMSRDSDAGWVGISTLQRMVDHKGDLPKSSGYQVRDGMERQLYCLREISNEEKRAYSLVSRLTKNQREAVAFDRHYRNRVKVAFDPISEQRYEILWTDERVAAVLEIDKNCLHQRIHAGYRRLIQLMGLDKKDAA